MFKKKKKIELVTGLERRVEMLVDSIDKINPTTGKMLWRSFLRGMFTALGATVGLSLALALLTFILATLRVVPGLNKAIDQTNIERILPTPSR